MTMRVELGFPRPLAPADQMRATVALGALVGSRHVVFVKGGYGAVLSGEGLEPQQVVQALDAAGIAVASALSSLCPPAGPLPSQPAPAPIAAERYRPLGR